MDIDEFEDFLDADQGLAEDGSHKRTLADFASQQEAAQSLGGPSDSKRPKVGSPDDELDEEMLALLDSEPQEPWQALGTANGLSATEEQELLALAAATQPSQPARSPPGLTRRATTTAGAHTLGVTEERELVALAASTQPTVGAAGGGATTAGLPAVPAHARNAGEAVDLSAELEDLLDEEEAGAGSDAQRREGAAAVGGQPGADAGPEFLLPPRRYVAPVREVFRVAGPSLEVTSESGERVYCQLHTPDTAAAPGGGRGRRVDVAGVLRRTRGSLLSEPISSLLQSLERDQFERAVAESAAAQRQRTPGAGRAGGGGGGSARGASSLWVQKHAPRSYIDLLSDEQINREVVRWLKGWDPCVFGSAAPAAPPRSRLGGQPQGQQQREQGWAGAPDPLGRPEHKVILIAGPPGLGKTTLAHVCAAHCGYRPLEINASDDRGGAALQARIQDAVEMQSVMGERRPNCVIIDEIDGATGGAEGRSGIAALLKIVNAPAGKAAGGAPKGRPERDGGASDSDADEPAGAGRGGLAPPGPGARGRRLRPLTRPIICICNDLYAPALRPLRDVARVFHFRKPQAERLAQRLQAVCAAEGLSCEKSTLRLLVERTECDIRSCLNTLQFLAKKQSTVRAADLSGLRVGQKDMTKGAFAVWGELLQKKKAPGIVGRAAEGEAQRVARLYDMLADFGEGELVLGGVHQNVLGLRYFDMAMQRTAAVLRQLGDADAFLRACHRRADFSLVKYVPAPLVLVGGVVAGPDRPQLQWPRASFEAQRRQAATASLLQAWMLGVAPLSLAAAGRRGLLLEVLPALMHVAAPALRPVSQQLYSAAEQEEARRLVDTLLRYNLRYCLDPAAQEAEAAELAARQAQDAGGAAAADPQPQQQQQQQGRAALGEAPLRFRPAVHRACLFPGMPPKGKQLPAAVRQTLSHEADMEAIRRADASRAGPHRGGGDSPAAAIAAPSQPRSQAAPLPGPVPLTLAQRMQAAGTAAAAARKQAAAAQRKGTWLDAMKEQRQARACAAGGERGAGGGRRAFSVLYVFHEGVTNAVKRPVLMSSLL